MDEGRPSGPPPPPAADGPPPPPAPVAGRARRRWPLILALVVVLAGVPTGLVLLSQLDTEESAAEGAAVAPEDEGAPEEGDRGTGDDGRDDGRDDDDELEDDAPGAGSDDPQPDPDDPQPDPDADPDVDPDVAPLDLAVLTGIDLLWGQLLTDIDASERAMIAFQEGLSAAFSAPTDLDDTLDAASEVAADQRAALLEVRDRLDGPLDDPAAEQVRERYVTHLDSWESFMAAVEDEPLVVLEQSERGFTVDINATADAFARALEEELPDDVDPEVERFAEGILDRGFRGFGTAQV